jgi:hypothetical protein
MSSETNAAIQILDKAGKVGDEGGIALRNVLAIMGEGRFLPKPTIAALQNLGISIDGIGDKSKTFSERLELLRPLLKDQAALTQVFGRENSTAALALIQSTQELHEFDMAIRGSNAAQKQAEIVMESYEERMKRSQARIADMKISWFNLTESIQPYLSVSLEVVSEIGKVAQGFTALSSVIKLNTIAKVLNTTVTTTWMVVTRLMTGVFGAASLSVSVLTGRIKASTAATTAWGMAVRFLSGPIGWITVAVGAAAVAYNYFTSSVNKQTEEQILNSRIQERANEINGETIIKIKLAKEVLDNENASLSAKQRAYNQLIDLNPEFAKTLKLDAQGHLDGAAAIDVYVSKLQKKAESEAQYQILVENEKEKNAIRKRVQERMDKLGVNTVTAEDVLDKSSPHAYGVASDAVLNNIGFFEHLVDKSWSNFSSDVEDFSKLTKQNEMLQKKMFAADKEPNKTATAPSAPLNNTVTPANPPTASSSGLGKKAGKTARENTISSESTGAGAGRGSVRSLTINKLIENFTIQTTNIVETRQQIRQQVQEALLTAVSDFTLIEHE